MSIQKKSLISNLNATKKANVANASQADPTPSTTGVKTAKMSKLAMTQSFGKRMGTANSFGKKFAAVQSFGKKFAKI